MFPTCDVDLALSAELAERELELQSTRPRRVHLARRIMRQCHWPMTLTMVRVLEPYLDLDNRHRWRIVPRQRIAFVQV